MKIDFFQTLFLCRVNADTPIRQQLVLLIERLQ